MAVSLTPTELVSVEGRLLHYRPRRARTSVPFPPPLARSPWDLASGGGKGKPGSSGSPVSAKAWLRRDELGGGLLLKASVRCLKSLGH